MFAALERRDGDLGMRRVGGGDHHRVQVRPVEQLPVIGESLHASRQSLRVDIGHGGDAHARQFGQRRQMHPACQIAATDDTDVDDV
jgi:hypothetical protein